MLEIYVDGSAINNENPNKPTLGGVGICMISPKGDSVVANGEVQGFHYTVANDKLVDSDESIREHGQPMLELDLGKTTNNTTELAAIYVALSYFEGGAFAPVKIKIYGDSQYAGNLVFGNWKPKENKELVAKVKQMASKVPNDVTWEYVKAHADNQYNNYADYLARSGAYKTPEEEVLSFNEWLLTA